jgi:ABC-2 type transport system permease protein
MKTSLLIVLNEIRKGLLVTWHYKFNVISEFITLGIYFLGTALLMNYGNTDLEEFGPSLIGYIVWVYSSYILKVSLVLTLEGRSGTLEQMYMSPVHPALIFIGASISTIVSSTLMIIFMSLIIAYICSIYIPFHCAAIPVMIIILVGLIGFGLCIAGMALLYKNVAGLIDLIDNILFYLSGSMLPIEQLPAWIQKVAHTLPTAEGIIVLRDVIFESQPLSVLLRNGKLFSLVINSGLYFIVGLLLFIYCEKLAKKKGRLGQY